MAANEFWQSFLFWMLVIIAIFMLVFVVVGIARDYIKKNRHKKSIKSYFVYIGILILVYGLSLLVLNVSAVNQTMLSNTQIIETTFNKNSYLWSIAPTLLTAIMLFKK